MFDIKTMQARFHELGRKRDAVLAQSAPARAQRDALQRQVSEIERQIAPLTATIKQIEADLFNCDQERAIIARALGGKTGAAA